MVDRIGQQINRTGGIQRSRQPQPAPHVGSRPGAFSNILAQKLGEVKFSSHATQRLQTRGIRLGEDQMRRLSEAVDLAAGKGAKEALILVDDVAMVVSVANRTVVTAMDRDQARANVFTNIDSAVIT